jgi:hypothetical protein
MIVIPIQKHCDFCDDPGPCWYYPAQSFDAPSGAMGSLGEWSACETCHDLIEAGNSTALAKRCAELICKDSMRREACFAHMLKLHAEFARHRTGDAFRIDH